MKLSLDGYLHNFGFRLVGVALGSIIYYLVLQLVIWMGIDTDLMKLLSAVVVAVFLAIPTWKSRYFSKFVAKEEDNGMLEIREISKTFNRGTVNEKKALRGLSLTLKDGDFVTVIGGNGAGKSTLLNAIAGVLA